MTVLVAEDHEVNLKIISFMLEKLGCEVLTAKTGLQAVESYRNSSPDLVLMDLRMPEMDGYDAVRAIRKIERENGLKKVPISALSANSLETDRLEARNAGMDFFMTKPLRVDELKRMLEGFENSCGEKEGDPVFDFEDLSAMFGGEQKILRSLLLEFLSGVPGYVERMNRYAAEEDYSTLEGTAHTLKGQLLNIRAASASENAASVEKAAREKDRRAVEQALGGCENSLAVLIGKINKHIKE